MGDAPDGVTLRLSTISAHGRALKDNEHLLTTAELEPFNNFGSR